MSEALTLQLGSLIPASEHAAARRGGAPTSGTRRYKARFVRAGRVRAVGGKASNLVIHPRALQTAVAAGLFDNKAVFLDHASLWEYPSLKDIAGSTCEAIYDEREESVLGQIRLNRTPAGEVAAALLEDLLAHPQTSPDIGLSLVFYPQWDEPSPEAEDKVIVGIRHIESIDLVFEPAADGRILQALSSLAAARSPAGPRPFHDKKKGTFPMSEPVQRNPTTQDQDAPLSQVERWNETLARTLALEIIAHSGLPKASQERLAAQPWFNAEDLQRAIDEERAYLASLQADQVIRIGNTPPRSPHIAGMTTPLERIRLATEALIQGTRPPSGIQPLTGIRELYHLLSGDYEMTGIFQPERVQFANVTCSTMASLVADALNKLVVNEFQQYPQWWAPIVIEQNFQSLQSIKWITLGGIGELPTVAEGAAYTELTWDEVKETGTFIKKGGYLGITLEAIDKDDTGRLQAAPRALAQAAWLTLSKAVSNIFTANSGVGPTMEQDSTALFHTNHGNLGTTALSIASWAAARTAMRKMTEVNSGERLGVICAPKFLLVPPDLEMTALQVLASEKDYSYALSNGTAAPDNVLTAGDSFSARLQYAASRVIVVDLWTDTNNWAAVADPRLYPTIGIGYRYGRTPEVFSVASPTAGLMFTNDTMPIKVRFFYAVGPMDYRGLYKANVAGG